MLEQYPALPATVVVSATPELIELADCCLACSGSVSLELLYHAKPSVIGYRVGRFAFWAQNKFRTVKYITLANLIGCKDIYCKAGTGKDFTTDAEQALMPEFLSCEDKSAEIASKITHWLDNDTAREQVVDRLKSLRNQYAGDGASTRAAEYIYRQLGEPIQGTRQRAA